MALSSDLDNLFEFVDNKNIQLTIPLYGYHQISEIPLQLDNMCIDIENDEKSCGECAMCLEDQLLKMICDGKYKRELHKPYKFANMCGISRYANIYQLEDDRYLYVNIKLENNSYTFYHNHFDYDAKIIQYGSELNLTE